MIQPLNNNCLIEVIKEYEGLAGVSSDGVQKGILKTFEFTNNHLTASTGYYVDDLDKLHVQYEKYVNKVVYWQEYADAGSKFKIDGKEYVLVPFYRLIGVEDGK